MPSTIELPQQEAAVLSADRQYRALLAVSEAIVSQRDLSTLFHELANRLHQVVRFDYLGLVLHEAASNTMRPHVLEASGPAPPLSASSVPVEGDPAGSVWQTQQPLIIANASEQGRWQGLAERCAPYGVQSSCFLPLTTARRRLGALIFACKQPDAYDGAELGFLQLVANQVAVAVDNALAFQEIEALRDKLHKEKAYLEEEVRTEHNLGQIVGESAPLRQALKLAETVAPTGSTVLIRGETGTGKELVARAIHDLSPRKDRTFVKLNCAAIPTGLLESELFGHERGAFTGAIAQKVGRFELAHQGTLFLDEVDDIPRLVRHFTQRFARRMGRRIETIPSEVMDALVHYPWQGNIRELQNIVERAVILSPGPSLQVPLGELQPAAAQANEPTAAATTLADAEKEHILGVLRDTGWVVGGPEGAASRLGLRRSTLQWKMKKLGVLRPN